MIERLSESQKSDLLYKVNNLIFEYSQKYGTNDSSVEALRDMEWFLKYNA